MQRLWPFFVTCARQWLLTAVSFFVRVGLPQFLSCSIDIGRTDDFVIGNPDRSSDASGKDVGMDVVRALRSYFPRLSTYSWMLGS